MRAATRQRLRLSSGTELSFITGGEASSPAVLLLHGSPSSARMFREVIPELSQAAHVIAPDLPGFGESDVLQSPSFPAFAQAVSHSKARATHTYPVLHQTWSRASRQESGRRTGG